MVCRRDGAGGQIMEGIAKQYPGASKTADLLVFTGENRHRRRHCLECLLARFQCWCTPSLLGAPLYLWARSQTRLLRPRATLVRSGARFALTRLRASLRQRGIGFHSNLFGTFSLRSPTAKEAAEKRLFCAFHFAPRRPSSAGNFSFSAA